MDSQTTTVYARVQEECERLVNLGLTPELLIIHPALAHRMRVEEKTDGRVVPSSGAHITVVYTDYATLHVAFDMNRPATDIHITARTMKERDS